MKIDTTLLTPKLGEMAIVTRAAESLGFDGIWTAETQADPFLPLTLAAEHSRRVNIGTAIAVTFPRSPATLAYLAWDLQRYSNGRFILGLGAQVKAHNVLRFGVKWEKPVKKMHETIEAIHAFWHAWQTGEPFRYVGEFFKLTLMTPFFNPGPLDVPPPPIYIAAMNKMMLRLAGSHCEGVHIHALHTVKYLEEVAMPELAVGWARSDKQREDFSLSTAVFVVPTDEADYAAWAEQHVRQQISFYLSTPAYRLIAELHGWEDEAHALSQAARNGQWDKMPAMVNDDMMEALVVFGTWTALPGMIKAKYGDLIDRVSYYLPYVPGENEAGWRATIASFIGN
jgi:probable F420-dependent oxidoreductase